MRKAGDPTPGHDPPATPRRLTLVSLPALPVVDPMEAGAIGGTEVRAWAIARGLAKEQHEVSLFVRGRSDKSRRVEGVEVHVHGQPMYARYLAVGRAVRRRPHFPYLSVRRWSPRLLIDLPWVAAHRAVFGPPGGEAFESSLRQHVVENPATAVVAFGVQSTARRCVRVAANQSVPSVVVIGCDDDLDARYGTQPDFVNPYGDTGADCSAALKQCDEVICQTEDQLRNLRGRFGRSGVLVPNPVDLRVWSPNVRPSPVPGVEPGYALWIGRAEPVHKRPQVLIELARECPTVRFLMVLNPANPAVEAVVRRDAPANVTIVPRVAMADMPGVYAAAGMVLNTSAVEGFANAMLQAAAMNVPVLSLETMGDWLAATGAGECFHGDRGAIIAAIREGRPRTAARTVVAARHDAAAVARQFAAAIPANG